MWRLAATHTARHISFATPFCMGRRPRKVAAFLFPAEREGIEWLEATVNQDAIHAFGCNSDEALLSSEAS